jgi:hypothetical protein
MSVCINSQDSYNYIASVLYTVLSGNRNFNNESTRYLFYRTSNFYDDFVCSEITDDSKLKDFISTGVKKLYYYNIESYIQRYDESSEEAKKLYNLARSYQPKIDVNITLNFKSTMQALNYLASFNYQNELEDWNRTFYLYAWYTLTVLVFQRNRESMDLDW